MDESSIDSELEEGADLQQESLSESQVTENIQGIQTLEGSGQDDFQVSIEDSIPSAISIDSITGVSEAAGVGGVEPFSLPSSNIAGADPLGLSQDPIMAGVMQNNINPLVSQTPMSQVNSIVNSPISINAITGISQAAGLSAVFSPASFSNLFSTSSLGNIGVMPMSSLPTFLLPEIIIADDIVEEVVTYDPLSDFVAPEPDPVIEEEEEVEEEDDDETQLLYTATADSDTFYGGEGTTEFLYDFGSGSVGGTDILYDYGAETDDRIFFNAIDDYHSILISRDDSFLSVDEPNIRFEVFDELSALHASAATSIANVSVPINYEAEGIERWYATWLDDTYDGASTIGLWDFNFLDYNGEGRITYISTGSSGNDTIFPNYIQPDFLSLYTPYTELGNVYYDGGIMTFNINFAGSGNDTVYALTNVTDIVNLGPGNDTMLAYPSAFSQNQADTYIGGDGTDTLAGSSSNDHFGWNDTNYADSGVTATNSATLSSAGNSTNLSDNAKGYFSGFETIKSLSGNDTFYINGSLNDISTIESGDGDDIFDFGVEVTVDLIIKGGNGVNTYNIDDALLGDVTIQGGSSGNYKFGSHASNPGLLISDFVNSVDTIKFDTNVFGGYFDFTLVHGTVSGETEFTATFATDNYGVPVALPNLATTINDFWLYDNASSILYYDSTTDQDVSDATIVAKIENSGMSLTNTQLVPADIQYYNVV